MTLGMALGSGGARGWCHIGVLREMEAMGIVPDVVAGCSMGALVGAAWAGGALDRLEDWALGLTRAALLEYVDPTIAGGGLVRGSGVGRLLTHLELPERIEALQRPFLAVASDMGTGREIWLQRGSVLDAVRASVSIPGVFCPHRVKGRWLLDGGLVNPVPTSATRALGAEVSIAVNPNARAGGRMWQPQPRSGRGETLWSEAMAAKLPAPVRDWMVRPERKDAVPDYVDVVSTAIDIMTDYVRATRQASDRPDVLLDADLQGMRVLELYRAAEAIEEGKRLVRDNADALRRAATEARLGG